MVKVETIGMYDVAKVNPTLVSDKATKNYSFITVDGILYLIDNTVVGDDAYKENIEIPAGEKLNGYVVEAWKGQKLIVDAKHIKGGTEKLKKNDVLVVNEDGTLKTGSAAGVHFVVDSKTTLTEPAVKVVVTVA